MPCVSVSVVAPCAAMEKPSPSECSHVLADAGCDARASLHTPTHTPTHAHPHTHTYPFIFQVILSTKYVSVPHPKNHIYVRYGRTTQTQQQQTRINTHTRTCKLIPPYTTHVQHVHTGECSPHRHHRSHPTTETDQGEESSMCQCCEHDIMCSVVCKMLYAVYCILLLYATWYMLHPPCDIFHISSPSRPSPPPIISPPSWLHWMNPPNQHRHHKTRSVLSCICCPSCFQSCHRRC